MKYVHSYVLMLGCAVFFPFFFSTITKHSVLLSRTLALTHQRRKGEMRSETIWQKC